MYFTCFFHSKYLFNIFAIAQCANGTVYLNIQTGIQNYLANFRTCEIINGDLIIADANGVSELTEIIRIEGVVILKTY